MKFKIFCHCTWFPSWSGSGLNSTPVCHRGCRASSFANHER